MSERIPDKSSLTSRIEATLSGAEHQQLLVSREMLEEICDVLEWQRYADIEHEHLGCPTAKTGIYAVPTAHGSAAVTPGLDQVAVPSATKDTLDFLRDDRFTGSYIEKFVNEWAEQQAASKETAFTEDDIICLLEFSVALVGELTGPEFEVYCVQAIGPSASTDGGGASG